MSALLAATRDGVVRVTLVDAGEPRAERTLAGEDVRCLAVDGETVYAGLRAAGVRRSRDGGRSWEAAGLEGVPVRSLAAAAGAVYAGTKEPRVHVSHDDGARWLRLAPFPLLRRWWWAQPAERPIRPTYVSALAVTPDAIVAGIEACGVLRSTDGGASWGGHRRRALRDCHDLRWNGSAILEAGRAARL